MKKIIRMFCMLCFLLNGAVVGASEPKKLIFAPLPMHTEETVYEMFAPMVKYLEKKLNVTIEYRFSTSYDAMFKSIEDGHIDFAYLGPLPYVEFHSKRPSLNPLVFFNEPNGKPFYTCAIVAWGNEYRPLSEITTHARFALTDPLSTCGYFSVEGLLKPVKKTLKEQPFSYLGKHDKVALDVVRGKFEYGGIKSDIARQYEHLGLEIIAQTEPFPSFALVADSQKMPIESMQAIVNAMLEIPKEERLQWNKSIRNGVTQAEDKAYEPIRTLQKEGNKSEVKKQ